MGKKYKFSFETRFGRRLKPKAEFNYNIRQYGLINRVMNRGIRFNQRIGFGSLKIENQVFDKINLKQKEEFDSLLNKITNNKLYEVYVSIMLPFFEVKNKIRIMRTCEKEYLFNLNDSKQLEEFKKFFNKFKNQYMEECAIHMFLTKKAILSENGIRFDTNGEGNLVTKEQKINSNHSIFYGLSEDYFYLDQKNLDKLKQLIGTNNDNFSVVVNFNYKNGIFNKVRVDFKVESCQGDEDCPKQKAGQKYIIHNQFLEVYKE